jgi:hypothetical protein
MKRISAKKRLLIKIYMETLLSECLKREAEEARGKTLKELAERPMKNKRKRRMRKEYGPSEGLAMMQGLTAGLQRVAEEERANKGHKARAKSGQTLEELTNSIARDAAKWLPEEREWARRHLIRKITPEQLALNFPCSERIQ